MSGSVRPQRRQPTRLPHPWQPPGKNTGVGCHCLLQCRKVKSESEALSRVRLLVTPWTAAYQAPPSMGFSDKSTGVGCCHCLLRIIPRIKISSIENSIDAKNSDYLGETGFCNSFLIIFLNSLNYIIL